MPDSAEPANIAADAMSVNATSSRWAGFQMARFTGRSASGPAPATEDDGDARTIIRIIIVTAKDGLAGY
jgi:hypothetical protein